MQSFFFRKSMKPAQLHSEEALYIRGRTLASRANNCKALPHKHLISKNINLNQPRVMWVNMREANKHPERGPFNITTNHISVVHDLKHFFGTSKRTFQAGILQTPHDARKNPLLWCSFWEPSLKVQPCYQETV
jgi:hypothetical protein